MALDHWQYWRPDLAIERKWSLGCGRCCFNFQDKCVKNVKLYPKMGREDCTYWKPKKKQHSSVNTANHKNGGSS